MSFRMPGEGGILKQGWTGQLRREGRDRRHMIRADDFGKSPLYPAGRRCAHCPTILRRTNSSDTCALCQLCKPVLVADMLRKKESKRLAKKAQRRLKRFLASASKRS